MVLYLAHGIIAEGLGGIAEAVFIAGEIEDVAITEETPVAETGYVEAEVTAVLIVDTGGFGKSIAEDVVEIGGVVAVECDKCNASRRIKPTTRNKSEAPFIAS